MRKAARRKMYAVGDDEVLSQAGLFFCHLLSLLLHKGSICHYIMKSLTHLWRLMQKLAPPLLIPVFIEENQNKISSVPDK